MNEPSDDGTAVLVNIDDDDDDNIGDIEPGSEPGASSEHYLVTTNSLEELEEGEGYSRLHEDIGGDSNPSHANKLKHKKNGAIRQLIKEDHRKQKTDQLTALKSRDSFVSSSDEAGSSTSANVSESESDFVNSQELDVHEGFITSDKVRSGSTITDSIEKLKLARSESVVSDVDSELEFVQSDEWKNKKKHIFVLSQSGKPIYSRYGNEEKLVTIYGVMQALVSFITHGDEPDLLRSIVAGDRKFVFLVKENLVLVAVSSRDECVRHLQLQLSYVYNQIISVLTLTSLNKIFKQRVNYDLRRMLSGTEKFLDNILNVMDNDTSYLLGSVRCLPLNSGVRDTITQTIAQCCKIKDLVFAIMISNNQLVTLVRMKKFVLHPQDLHILLNIVQASDAFKNAESWLPICLPKFDSGGFLHTYVSYLDEPCNACLLLLTVDSEQFPVLSECRNKVVERLNRYSCLKAVAESVAMNGYRTSEVGLNDIWHFIYKSRSTSQFTCPEITAPYLTDGQRERLHDLYLNVHGRMHSTSRPLRILYKTTQYESILGWVTSGFELYTVFSPLITKTTAISSVNKLLKWMKKEESKLFIQTQTTF